MRDIRKDIRDRLENLQAEKAELGKRLQLLTEREKLLQTLLSHEEMIWSQTQAILPLMAEPTDRRMPRRSYTPLGHFLAETLSDGREWTSKNLVTLAVEKGIPIKSKSPLRAIHFALVGMKQNHLVEMVGRGTWRWSNSRKGHDQINLTTDSAVGINKDVTRESA